MSDDFLDDVRWLLKSLRRGLENHQADTPEAAEVLARLAAQDLAAAAFSPPRPQTLPACAMLPDAVGAAAPAVPWASIVAMRNRLVHAYFDIDRNIVWKTVAEEIPPLLSLLDTLVPEE